MSTDEKVPTKAIGIRISEEKWIRLKRALATNGTTMQRSLEKWVDAYVEKYDPKPRP